MKFLFTIVLAFFTVHLLTAQQHIAVKSFRVLENDLDARTNFPIKDQNGDVCAIIKAVTTETGFDWDGDQLGIVKTVPKTGEIWIYVPFGAKRITIKHALLGVLRNYAYPLHIEKATVYEMTLTTGKVVTAVQEEKIKTAWLVLSSEPPGADVYIKDVLRGNAPYTEKMKPGKYDFRLEKALYHSESVTAEITGDEPDGKKEISVALRPAFGYLQIDAAPENGAGVFIDDVELPKKTPCKSGVLKSGIHRVTCRLNMYQPKTMDILIEDGKTAHQTMTLAPNFSVITIASRPPADIYIDGVKAGEGKYTGRILPGLHTIEGKLAQHESDEQNIETAAGKDTVLNLAPRPMLGDVDITSHPIDAGVYINDVLKGTTSLTLNKMPIGAYRLSLVKAGFEMASKNIQVQEGKNTEVNISLKPRSMGRGIYITSYPADANVYINNELKGATPLTLNKMPAGAYPLLLMKKGFETVSKNIEVQGGKTTEVNISLELRSTAGRIYITSYPADANVYINNELKGATPLTLNKMPAGAYQLLLMKKGFETVSKNIEVQDAKTTVTNEILRKKGTADADGNTPPAENQPASPEGLEADVPSEERRYAEGDTLQSKRRKKGFGAFDILFGKSYALGKRSAFKIHFPRVEFNTAEGVNVAYRTSYFKRSVRGDVLSGTGRTRRLEISPDFRYAFARRKFTGFLKVEYKTRTGRVSLAGGRYIQQFNGNEPVLPLVNTFYTIIQGYNYMKIFERDFIELNFQKALKSKFAFSSSWSLAKRHELFNKIRYTYYKKNRNRLTPNAPVNAAHASASFSDHIAFTGRLGLEIAPWRKFDARNQKHQTDYSSPVFSLNYTKGFNKIRGSDVNYELLEAGVRFDIRQRLEFILRAGKFLNVKSMYFMDYKHFAGTLTIFATADPASSFRFLDYYRYSTNKEYFTAHIHYKFSSFEQSQNLFVNYLDAPYSGNFTEAGYSFNDIFRFFRLELAASFQNGIYANKGFRIGVSSDLTAYFSDK